MFVPVTEYGYDLLRVTVAYVFWFTYPEVKADFICQFRQACRYQVRLYRYQMSICHDGHVLNRSLALMWPYCRIFRARLSLERWSKGRLSLFACLPAK